MDDTTKGGSDKRGWRERLGIGTKEMPRISDEFKTPEVSATVEKTVPRPVEKPADRPSAASARSTPLRAPLPISKPAPMAPRATAKGPMPPVSATPKPISPAIPQPQQSRPATAPQTQPGLAPDALANRLKAQREAAEKLAEQRIQVARQRAEAAARGDQSKAPSIDLGNLGAKNGGGAKPKFSFAEDDARNQSGAPAAAPASPQLQIPKPMARPPGMPAPAPLAPPRQPLGAAPRSAQPQGYQPSEQGGYQAGYVPSPGYAPPQPQQYAPSYRPVDPVTGYAGPVPGARSAYAPPMPRSQPPQGYPAGEEDYGYAPVPARPIGRTVPPQRQPSPAAYGDPEDIFEQPVRGQRRPTAGEYRQAYQEPDVGYEEEQQRSIAPWFWVLMVLAALAAAGAGIWIWSKSQSQQVNAPTTKVEQPPEKASDTPPVVEPPATAAKTQPEQPAQNDVNTSGQVATPPAAPTKKQIYDRIVGDREVQGNAALAPTEIEPVAPDPAQPNAAPALQDQGAQDSAPLPVPPPPNNDGTQGALEPPPPLPGAVQDPMSTTGVASASGSQPSSLGTQVAERVSSVPKPASQPPPEIRTAGTVNDANTSDPAVTSSTQQQAAAELEDVLPMPKDKVVETASPSAAAPQQEPVVATKSEPETPVSPASSGPAIPSDAQKQFADAAAKASAGADEATSTVTTEETAEAAPSVTPSEDKQAESKQIAAATPESNNSSATNPASTISGKAADSRQSSKVVAKKKVAERKVRSPEPLVLVPPAGQTKTETGTSLAAGDGIYGELPQATDQKPATGKKRTLLDLFNQKNENAAQAQPQARDEQQVAVAQPKRIVAAPKPEEPARATGSSGGFVAQLASFASRDEASQEFQRIKSRHPEIVGGMAPVISEASVGGARRYRLAVGPMQSNAAAGQVCSRLLSAGERDCLVRKQ